MTDNSEYSSLQSEGGDDKWLDLYAILEVPADADTATLRAKIHQLYTDGTANYDHRNLNRRHYYHELVESILPICRRVLLNANLRATYDDQLELHQAGDESAMEFSVFVELLDELDGGRNKADKASQLTSAQAAPSAPAPSAPVPRAPKPAVPRPAAPSPIDRLPPLPPQPPQPINRRPPVMQPVISAPFRDEEPEPDEEPEFEDELEVEEEPEAEEYREAEADLEVEEPEEGLSEDAGEPATPASPVISPPLLTSSFEVVTVPTAPDATASTGYNRPRPLVSAAITNEPPPAPPEDIPGPRYAVPDNERAPRYKTFTAEDFEEDFSQPQRKLSDLSRMLLYAIMGTVLTVLIQHFGDNNSMAGQVARVPLVVDYSSELGGFMDKAISEFGKSGDGAGVDVQLMPTDSREGMFHALGQRTTTPDVWIPSESIWSAEYNRVARTYGKTPIDNQESIARSPIVLVARREHSDALLKLFPNRTIASWDALHNAIAASAPMHFGMTNPEKTGSGAVPRYFMAHEWANNHGVEWNPNALKNPDLWKWMNGFENNVPSYSDKSDDMVKDLALGSSDRYWWAIAFESEAIDWLSQHKPIEVFYLPQTSFGDHPYCVVPAGNPNPQVKAYSLRFEKYLLSDPMQHLLLARGFRPSGIDLKSNFKDNPFLNPEILGHGIKTTDVTGLDKFNYDTLNELNAQWHERYFEK